MENQFGPSSKLKPTLKDVKEFVKDATDDLLILGVFKDENDPLFVTFLDANNDLREEYTFGHTFDKQAMAFFHLKESSIIVVHPRHLVSQYEPKYPVFKVLVFSEIFAELSILLIPIAVNYMNGVQCMFLSHKSLSSKLHMSYVGKKL